MALCEQCGSVSLVKAHTTLSDRVLSLLTGRKPFRCRRCGWRARRAWTDQDLERLSEYGAGGAQVDPSLARLDDIGGQRPRKQTARFPKPYESNFDLVDLNLNAARADTEAWQTDGNADRQAPLKRRRIRRRRNRSNRREILPTVAVTAIVMFVLIVISLSGSCSVSPSY